MIFGKITGIGWFVVTVTILMVLGGRWLGIKFGYPIIFATAGGLLGIIISLLGVRSSVKDILNSDKNR